MKPDVVLFGEMLPADAMAEAESLANRADLMSLWSGHGAPSIRHRRASHLLRSLTDETSALTGGWSPATAG